MIAKIEYGAEIFQEIKSHVKVATMNEDKKVNTRRCLSVVLMLSQRRTRWPNTEPTLGQ